MDTTNPYNWKGIRLTTTTATPKKTEWLKTNFPTFKSVISRLCTRAIRDFEKPRWLAAGNMDHWIIILWSPIDLLFFVGHTINIMTLSNSDDHLFDQPSSC